MCAQSPKAYGPAAIRPDVFSACTGAITQDFYGPRSDGRPSLEQWGGSLGAPRDGRFDVVTLSFGGNDIAFADVIKGCLDLPKIPKTWAQVVDLDFNDGGCDVSESDLRSRIDALLTSKVFVPPPGAPAPQHSNSIVDFYQTVLDRNLTQGGILVVVGYPRLFAPSSTWGRWRNGRCNLVTAKDADMLGSVAEYFDQSLREAVREADPRGQRIIYESRLDIFDDGGRWHSLCGDQAEWLNGVTLGLRDGSLRVNHSFHPNELGHLASAQTVALDIDATFGRPSPRPTSSLTPSPVATGNLYRIGDRFSDYCVVAWPTAPVRYADSIEMRMTCQHVPGQFLFVDVAYGDPDLPVTPNTGYMLVEGRIVDIGHSGLGFSTLIVVADRIDLG